MHVQQFETLNWSKRIKVLQEGIILLMKIFWRFLYMEIQISTRLSTVYGVLNSVQWASLLKK